MVVSCSACGEQYGVTEDVTFHKFPANKDRREKWLAAVQRDGWTPAKRSMLCSKHFSPEEFIYKISKDKIRRYLKADTVPTIFNKTERKRKNGPPPRSGTNNKAPSSVITTPADLKSVPSQSRETDSTHSLNLEILAATSVALEPFLIPTSLKSTQLNEDHPEVVSQLVKTSADISPPVAATSSNCLGQTKSQKNKQNFQTLNKRVDRGMYVQTERMSLPKRVRQVYPGDFKQLNYNDVLEVSKSLTVQSNYMKKMRSKMRTLRQHNRRLEKRVTDLKSVVKFLKNRLVARNYGAVERCGPSNSPAASSFVPNGDRLRRFPNPLRDHDYISVNEGSTCSP